MSETEDLKEWIKIHFTDYDKSRLDLYMKEKKAYEDGRAKFDAMQYDLPPGLKIALRHESGLMEVARQRGFLFEYGYHAYRQIELVYTSFFEVSPGRSSVGDFLLGGGHIDNRTRLSAIVHPTVQDILSYNPGINPHTRTPYPFNPHNLVRKINNYQYNWSIHSWTENQNYLSSKDQDRLFRSAMFFNPFDNPNPNDEKSEPAKAFLWPSKNAFELIYHSRNSYAHLGIKNSDIKSVYKNLNPNRQEQIFIDNPVLILQSDYIERYVNMVVGLYSELHKVNYDLSAFHA